MAKFETFAGKTDGKYYFRFQANNNKIVLQSQGYTTRQECREGAISVKRIASNDNAYVRPPANDKREYYFFMKAGNGQQIARSETYDSVQGREVGISCVKREAPDAPIVDL